MTAASPTPVLDPVRERALAIAAGTAPTEKSSDVIARAIAYHAFLSGGGAVAASKAATTANPSGATKATETKPDPKTAASSNKAAASKAESKPDAKPAAKPAAAPKGGANAQAVAGDTKAPGGKNTYQDVVNALCKVRDKNSKNDAVKILAEDGGGAKSVRDLKPALYDAVVEGCENVLSEEGVETGAADPGDEFDDGTGGNSSDPSDI